MVSQCTSGLQNNNTPCEKWAKSGLSMLSIINHLLLYILNDTYFITWYLHTLFITWYFLHTLLHDTSYILYLLHTSYILYLIYYVIHTYFNYYMILTYFIFITWYLHTFFWSSKSSGSLLVHLGSWSLQQKYMSMHT